MLEGSGVERKRPYTARQLKGCKCFRCGDSAEYQWNACADGNTWRPLCAKCDLGLNVLVLKWLGFKDWRRKIAEYAKSIGQKFRG